LAQEMLEVCVGDLWGRAPITTADQRARTGGPSQVSPLRSTKN